LPAFLDGVVGVGFLSFLGVAATSSGKRNKAIRQPLLTGSPFFVLASVTKFVFVLAAWSEKSS
jgi:hypothetical protein